MRYDNYHTMPWKKSYILYIFLMNPEKKSKQIFSIWLFTSSRILFKGNKGRNLNNLAPLNLSRKRQIPKKEETDLKVSPIGSFYIMCPMDNTYS